MRCVSTLICGVYVGVMFVNMIKLHKISDRTCRKHVVLNIATPSCIFISNLLYSIFVVPLNVNRNFSVSMC